MAKDKKKAKNYCKPTIKDTCLGARVNLVCTDYDGILPEGSEYDEDSCLSGQDIIEDIIDILDDHTEQLDLSDFGCCLEYEASGDELVVKDVLATHEKAICDLLEKCGGTSECGCSGNSSENDSPCQQNCDNIQPYQIGLVHYTTGVGNTDLDGAFSTFTPINSYGLNYKTKVAGVYKLTVDLDYEYISDNDYFEVGVSIDGNQPVNDSFNMERVSVMGTSKTLHFIVDVNKGVNLNIFFKQAVSNTVTLYKAKLIIEKVK